MNNMTDSDSDAEHEKISKVSFIKLLNQMQRKILNILRFDINEHVYNSLEIIEKVMSPVILKGKTKQLSIKIYFSK